MRKYLAYIVFVFCTVRLYAQQDSTSYSVASSESKRMAVLRRMTYELSLSGPQRSEVDALLLTRSAKVIKCTLPVGDRRRRRIKRINTSTRRQLKKVLTPAQYESFVALRQSLREQRAAASQRTRGNTTKTDDETDF